MPACPRLIAEFAPQSGVLLTWPHACSDWRDQLDSIEPLYGTLVAAISRHERVIILCHDAEHQHRVQATLRRQAGIKRSVVQCLVIASDDTWVRDYGPLSLRTGRHLQLCNYIFNGWGGKHEAGLDNRVTVALLAAGILRCTDMQTHPLVLEGGAIDTDGRGTLLATTRCLLSPGRNPSLDQTALAATLQRDLGIERILWLDHGWLAGDDSDGHVDMLARFCSPHDIAYLRCDDPNDVHYPALRAMEEQLQSFKTCDGGDYRLHALPLPQAVHAGNGERLPASYANFLIINHCVLLPAYNDPADARAHSVLQRCFPDREIVTIDCRPLIQQYGSLHCATLQLADGML